MAQNIHEVSKQNLGGVLPAVLKQFSDEGDVIHLGVIKVNERVVLMVHELIRVTLKETHYVQVKLLVVVLNKCLD